MAALILIMARYRAGNKPLSEPMLICLTDTYGITRPQWVNNGRSYWDLNLMCWNVLKIHKNIFVLLSCPFENQNDTGRWYSFSWKTRIWASSQYPKRRLFVRSRKVWKPRDWYFKLSYRSEIWQAHRQHCCQSACQISERSDNSKYKSRGFETLRDLTKRRLFGYWDGPWALFQYKDCLPRYGILMLKIRWSGNHVIFNSLWPNDAIWWHRSASTLAQVMACCLIAPSHYLNQCWLIISKIHLHSSDGNFTRDTSVIND